MNTGGGIQTAFVIASLAVFSGCKMDDAFVAGGGPAPGGGIGLQTVQERTNVAFELGPGPQSTTTGLVDDLTKPITYIAGDTLLLTGGTINGLSQSLPQPIDNTVVLVGNSVNLLGERINNGNLVGGIEETVHGTTVAVLSDSGGLLGGTTNIVNAAAAGLTGSNTLLGGVTDTVGDVTGTVDSLSSNLIGTRDLVGGDAGSVSADGVDESAGGSAGLLGTGLLR